MAEWVFDQNGNTAIILDNDCFRSDAGEVISWIVRSNIYSLNGNHIGWFENGAIYDSNNDVFGFTRESKGYLPNRPGLSGTPGMPGFSGKPGRPGLSGVPGRPGHGGWSRYNLEQYLDICSR